MKRALALFLTLIMCCSLLALAGCRQKNGELGPDAFLENYNFESYVAEDSKIIGTWKESLPKDSKSDKTFWRFESTTALNIIETVDGSEATTACGYNYNEKTNQLIYLICNTKEIMKVEVTIKDNTMTFKNSKGEVIRTFTK